MAKGESSAADKGAKKATVPKEPAAKPRTTRARGEEPAATAAGDERTDATPKADAAPPIVTAAAEHPASTLDDIALPASRGKAGVFGGPKDRSAKPDDKLGLPTGQHFVYERIRSLNAKSFYCAMRWNYHLEHKSPEEAKRWWANKKIAVTNSSNGLSVVVRAVDYGPHESTGLDISISPAAAEALGLEIGDEVNIAFADQKAALGPLK